MDRQILTLCNHRPAFLLLVLVFAAVVYAPGVANAQDATISRTVTDATGSILPGVTVEAQDGRIAGTVTDETGGVLPWCINTGKSLIPLTCVFLPKNVTC